jgi:hypothetical protein
MLGVPIDGPALPLGENKSVVLNAFLPSSILKKKKHHACAYHSISEVIAGGIMNFVLIPGVTNYADLLSKPLPNDTFHSLIKPLLLCVPKAGREIKD